MRFPRVLPDELPLGPIAGAALRCFAINGYHGTTIRQIAAEAGLSVAGVYHHFGSKQAILVSLCEVAMQELIRASEEAVAAAGADILDRFDALVECLVEFHADFSAVAFVTFSEIRSLEGAAQENHLASRRREQEIITGLVEEGVGAGVFTTDQPRHVARAISSICIGISQWYRPHQGIGLDRLTEIHVDICRSTAGIVDVSRRHETAASEGDTALI
ncbi:TetR/AcrR family transcriptional regulator [Nesterenkonia aerolata]|uniref:TetR/AcrR family transcriptional regulator n=1 Tax=Nesterenkonia aerolata TaxID=3074079 RepID=A0ABU2DPH0_9MICC|nr:TetR/AcrR family transcriptional regulator [Nesterenkonia sp. LY-0111]MDR8018391.1 TetR/AcrR family transcriptional regulator [Nesterenkonia sp. LY-0111]